MLVNYSAERYRSFLFSVSLIWLVCKIACGQWTELWATAEAKNNNQSFSTVYWLPDPPIFSFTESRVLNMWNTYYHLHIINDDN